MLNYIYLHKYAFERLNVVTALRRARCSLMFVTKVSSSV